LARKLTSSNNNKINPNTRIKILSLSDLDRKLLKILLSPDGRISSKVIARKLGIPATTVQRRRKRLESEFLTFTYSLDLKKFGWHRVDFFIATEGGKTMDVAKELLKREEVIHVGRSIGQQTIDLHVQTILQDNADILNMMELLKSTPGIKDVIWSEIVEVVGNKISVPIQIIDKL
jgi:DNA-binding Lrp family transcriptional regulator